jgi:hypothetical protein
VHFLPYGQGIFRRRFRLRGAPGHVVGDMEDDFHRFRAEIHHDGERVTAIRGEARRHPWTECPGAAAALQPLVGTPLSVSPTAAASRVEPRQNCTHLLDVASLALTCAAAGLERREYDIAVPDRHEWRTHATLKRDGEPMLAWDVAGTRIEGPAPYRGVEMRGGGFLRWSEEHLDPPTAEAVLALRRACFIAMGRARDLDAARSAVDYMGLAKGSCHSFTPGIAERALRIRGSTRDFTHAPGHLLADLESEDAAEGREARPSPGSAGATRAG